MEAPRPFRLRDVRLDDVDAYVAMRCDPVMMAELGGPLPRAGIEDKVARDVANTAADESWVQMIEVDGIVAGTVTLWRQVEEGEERSETGWMVLPAFQGRGLAKSAVRALLERARADGRWGVVHAFPGVTNGPSNGICRTLGFTLHGERVTEFSGRQLRSNHWSIDLS